MEWAYGITTVPERWDNLLVSSMASLAKAGFDRPHLFIDGEVRTQPDNSTQRRPRVGGWGNWALALAELWARNPKAERLAIFEDDILAVRNLRAYLERCPWPGKKSWLNLYTIKSNQNAIAAGGPGWHLSNQRGYGAVGLVFDRAAAEAVLVGLASMANRTVGKVRTSIDAAILVVLRKAEFQEWVHMPSLLQHVGEYSVLRKKRYAPECWFLTAPSFPGESFDAMEGLCPACKT